MENYICINGKKAELTEEQMKALGIEVPTNNVFLRKAGKPYYYITSGGGVTFDDDVYNPIDNDRYNTANYCTNREIMKQRALHETLNRLLWRYSMTHKVEEEHPHEIYYSRTTGKWETLWVEPDINYIGAPRFDTEEIAQQAIEEIVKPFMKAHPEFKF